MAGLMTVAVGRDPMSAPAGLAEAPAIHTHPEGSAARPAPVSALRRALAEPAKTGDVSPQEFHEPDAAAADQAPPTPAERVERPLATLHDRLLSAWSERDWPALVAIARSHLQQSGPTPRLHPVTAAAIEFFRPRTPGFQAGDAERFVRSFRDGELRAYAAGQVEEERRRLADDALALHCLGMLGQARFDYVGALRAIEAVTVCARLWDLGADELGIAPALIDRIVEMDVVLPRWSFEIDPCRRSVETWPEQSPLERKLAQVERFGSGPRPDSDCDGAPAPLPCQPTDPCCAKVNYYIADLLELRDWTHRYKAGDLAYIENIAAGETRSREHEMKRTRELFSETEISQRQSETRDLQVTDRASLKREIDRQTEQSFSGQASASATFGGKAYSATLSASASFARSSSEAVREAQEQAVETVNKAVSEIEKETRTQRSERITTEETEKNIHAFTNTTDEALVTKYFWVTRECRAQLYSYGKQMIAEFIVPEPARLYEHLTEVKLVAEVDKRIRPPRGKMPERPELGIAAEELNGGNYKDLCQLWGVKDPPPWPRPTDELSDNEVDDWPREETRYFLKTLNFPIPAGYEAVSMTGNFAGTAYLEGRNPRTIDVEGVGGTLFDVEGTPKDYMPFAPGLIGHQTLRVYASNTERARAFVTMQLVRQPGVLEAWQASVFKLLSERYEAKLAEYEKAMGPWDSYQQARDELLRELIAEQKSRHPFFNREIERTELKRAVIYLMCQDFWVNGAMIRRAEPFGYPEIDRTATDRQGYDWYFWDRLIDWKRMAYAFFDYFWNPMRDWPQRFDPDEPDALFKAFRRAGYARVLVPVSPAMRKDFLWYLSTHEKWGHQGPPSGGDPRWRNVVFELQQANEAAMTPREGHVDVTNGGNVVAIKGSDRYYNPAGTGLPDPAMIALDIDREIYVDGEVYLIVAIVLHPGSPPYNVLTPDSGWWQVVLDRPFEGASGTGRLYAMGAKAVAPPFSFDMPTELIWAGDKGKCLPTYPLPPCVP